MAYQTKFSGNTDKTIVLGKEGAPNSIEGYFLGSKDTNSEFGPGKLHVFQTKTGTIGVWGKTRLNLLLTSELVGQMVKATFTGMIQPSKKGRRPSYGFEVQHDPDNTTDTSGINLNATAEAEEDNEVLPESDDSAFEEETQDEAPTARPKAPAVAASVDASRQAKIQALLNKKR